MPQCGLGVALLAVIRWPATLPIPPSHGPGMLDIFSAPTFQIGLDLATSISLIISAIYVVYQLNSQSRKANQERLEKEDQSREQALYWQRQATYFTNYFEAVRTETVLLQRLTSAVRELGRKDAGGGLTEEEMMRAKDEAAADLTALSDFWGRYVREIITYAPGDYIQRLSRKLIVWNRMMDDLFFGDIGTLMLVRGAYDLHQELAVTARTIYAGGTREDAEQFVRANIAIVYSPSEETERAWESYRSAILTAHDNDPDGFEEFNSERSAERERRISERLYSRD